MIQRELTLKISGKTETDIANVVLGFLNLFKDCDYIQVLTTDGEAISNFNVTKFNWDAETVIAEKEESLEPYYEIADRLYTKLVGSNADFSSWEYKFISSNYGVAVEKGRYSPRQKEWLRKLEEKYL